jgi:hypothetical protein
MREAEDEPETAQEAFARMEGELALLRRAIERLAVERPEVPEPPDYSETLASMMQKIDATLQRADALVRAAKDGASPRHVVDRIVAAGANARAEDRRTIATAATELKDATRALQSINVAARGRYEQRRRLLWTAIGGVVLGMVLWAAFEVVARAVPAGAGEDGGTSSVRVAVVGGRIFAANGEALEACPKRPDRASGDVDNRSRMISGDATVRIRLGAVA